MLCKYYGSFARLNAYYGVVLLPRGKKPTRLSAQYVGDSRRGVIVYLARLTDCLGCCIQTPWCITIRKFALFLVSSTLYSNNFVDESVLCSKATIKYVDFIFPGSYSQLMSSSIFLMLYLAVYIILSNFFKFSAITEERKRKKNCMSNKRYLYSPPSKQDRLDIDIQCTMIYQFLFAKRQDCPV